MFRLKAIAALPLMLIALPAMGAQCVLDDEAYVVRSALPDEAGVVEDQSARGTSWYESGEPILIGERSYARSGAPVVVPPAELVFETLIGAVPIFARAGAADPPEILYASLDPLTCEVQPYSLAE